MGLIYMQAACGACHISGRLIFTQLLILDVCSPSSQKHSTDQREKCSSTQHTRLICIPAATVDVCRIMMC